MELKEINVNCSFCNTEIPCPEDMVNIKKHACIDCFQRLHKEWTDEEENKIHLCISKDKIGEVMPGILINSLMTDVFPVFWNRYKPELKELSKKEIAESMFEAGASAMIELYLKSKEESDDML